VSEPKASEPSSKSEPKASTAEKPFLRVVRGDATPEEIAVIIAVIAARSAGAPAAPAPRRSTWADRSRLVRRPVQLGWRASGLPG
jgi:hypothetical protein